MADRFFDLSDFFYQGKVQISDVGVRNMYDLCDIVIHKHFSYTDRQTREDLVSVGILKMIDLLSQNTFDVSRSSLKNYLYTGTRNEMRNYLYRISKEVIVDDEILLGMNEAPVEDVNYYLSSITNDEVDRVCKSIKADITERNKTVSTLKHIGFNGGCEGYTYYKEVEPIVALIIWRHLDSERR